MGRSTRERLFVLLHGVDLDLDLNAEGKIEGADHRADCGNTQTTKEHRQNPSDGRLLLSNS